MSERILFPKLHNYSSDIQDSVSAHHKAGNLAETQFKIDRIDKLRKAKSKKLKAKP